MLKAIFIAMSTVATLAAQAQDWQLVWSDEFDYEGLPDPAKWGYEEGFVRNSEAQYYTRDRLENARVKDGRLVIEGRKEQFPNPRYEEGSKSWQKSRKSAGYTAASIITLKKASWQYGRIEVKAKLPKGKGMWPAIWMLGTSRGKVRWPACGEIDIMEFVGKNPDHVHGTVHFAKDGKKGRHGGKIKTAAPSDDFHVYAIEWNAEKIDFFFDSRKYHTFPVEKATSKDGGNPFRKPFYLLINLAIGGSWGGPIDDSIFPQKYLIDYVRVYTRPGQN